MARQADHRRHHARLRANANTVFAGNHHVCPARSEVGIRGDRAGALAEKVLIPAAVRLRDPGARHRDGPPRWWSQAATRCVRPAPLRSGRVRPCWCSDREPSGSSRPSSRGSRAEVHVAGVWAERSLALARAARGGRTPGSSAISRAGGADRFDSVIEATSDSRDARAGHPAREARGPRRLHRSVARHRVSSTRATSHSRTSRRSASCRLRQGLAGAIESFADGSVVPDAIVSEVIALDDVPSRLEGRRGADAGPGPKVHVDPRL